MNSIVFYYSDCGTHVDSPSHWGQPGGKAARTISDLTMEELVAPGCVVDVRAKCEADHDYLLTVEDVRGCGHIYLIFFGRYSVLFIFCRWFWHLSSYMLLQYTYGRRGMGA